MAIAPWDFDELSPTRPQLRLIGSVPVSGHPPAQPKARCRLHLVLPVDDDHRQRAEVVPLPSARPGADAAMADRRPRASARVRRRRLAVGAMVAGLVVLLALPLSALGGEPVTAAPKPLVGSRPGHPVTYVVQPGDTLWSIATRLSPDGDPRPLVAQMEAGLGSATIEPGQRIVLPD